MYRNHVEAQSARPRTPAIDNLVLAALRKRTEHRKSVYGYCDGPLAIEASDVATQLRISGACPGADTRRVVGALKRLKARGLADYFDYDGRWAAAQRAVLRVVR